MQIELKIDPASIEKQVTEAIVASAFGKQLKEAIDSALKNMGSSYSWDNQLKKFVEGQMVQIVRETIETEYKDAIVTQLRAKLTPELLSGLTDQVVNEAIRQVRVSR